MVVRFLSVTSELELKEYPKKMRERKTFFLQSNLSKFMLHIPIIINLKLSKNIKLQSNKRLVHVVCDHNGEWIAKFRKLNLK